MEKDKVRSGTPTSYNPSVAALLNEGLDTLFWVPKRSAALRPWREHVPFAHWLTAVTRPLVLVDSGENLGVSFAAFCEGTLKSQSGGRCYAIAPQTIISANAGTRNEAFGDVDGLIQEHYGSFADLIEEAPDEAIRLFQDGTIDLLHLGGERPNEALRDQFAHWLPKLSSRGVVLIHGTNIKDPHAGVGQFWDEVRTRYPSFEFLNGEGLGVLAVGPQPTGIVQELCGLGPVEAQLLRNRFADISALWISADNAERYSQNLRKAVTQAGHTELSHKRQIEAVHAELSKSGGRLIELDKRITDLLREKETLERLLSDAEKTLASVYRSRSWRVMKLLRSLASLGRFRSGRSAGSSVTVQPEPQEVDASVPDEALVELSGLFDEAEYLCQAGSLPEGMTAARHYLDVGEKEGLRPSSLFDPNFYRRKYRDVSDAAVSELVHYLRYGRTEGRSPRAQAWDLDLDTKRLDRTRQTVIVIMHEGKRGTSFELGVNLVEDLGSKYNIVVLHCGGGVADAALYEVAGAVISLPANFAIDDVETDMLAETLVERYAPLYVVANDFETAFYVPGFEKCDIPVVALVNQFPGPDGPRSELRDLYHAASQLIFPAKILAEAALRDYWDIRFRYYHIIAPGPAQLERESQLPTVGRGDGVNFLPRAEGTVLVVGGGAICIDQGVEFFVATAAAVRRRCGDLPFQFAWVHNESSADTQYLSVLLQQVLRSDLADCFSFVEASDNIDPVYGQADLCLLSARIDPHPDFAINCALRGIPVVSFAGASSFSEKFGAVRETSKLVVPYLDEGAAAEMILSLARDECLRRSISTEVQKLARTSFDLTAYVQKIDELGLAAVEAIANAKRDFDVISRADVFNAKLYARTRDAKPPAEELADYLQVSRISVPRGRSSTGHLVRRPLEGFNPFVYVTDCTDYDEATGEDPLAHYVRNGCPNGRWSHPVLRPAKGMRQDKTDLKLGVHGHFHYPELLPEFLERIGRNNADVDLILTTSSAERAEELKRVLGEYKVDRADVAVVPNRGRDIGAFFSGISKVRLCSYDLVGHFHGKRSPHMDTEVGESWRNFLWEHLVGGDFAMIDEIANAFEKTENLGLVFAEEPNLNDWDSNLEVASDLALRMGMRLPLPQQFDFPQGTMFWARPSALVPLLDLGLKWDDYPPEPLPADGTILHALERLLTFSAEHAGYHYATTYLSDHGR